MKMNYIENGIYDYTEVLEAIPYYDDVRGIFLSLQIPEWKDKVGDIKDIILQAKNCHVKPREDFEDDYMERAKQNHEIYKKALELSRRMGLDCCRLVEYIGNYPDRWPFPKESEKNQELEKLLEKYDIMPSYYAYDDLDLLQITGDDIHRLDDTMIRSLNMCRKIIEDAKTSSYFQKLDENEFLDSVKEDIAFPPSYYQKRNKSYREERKMYLRRQGHKI